ncbi:MAG: hypothetical protein QM698_01645 [Micropepsaceae bacterium]
MFGQHLCPGQRVEQRRLAGIGVADQRNDGEWNAPPCRPVQGAGANDLLQFLADTRDALADQPPVGFDLRFAGAAQEAEAAPLALEVGPAPHQAAALIGEMGEFDLQTAFPRARPLAEDFQDQTGAVDDLGLEVLFEIALLHRRERTVEDDDGGVEFGAKLRRLLHLAFADIGRRAWGRHRHQP